MNTASISCHQCQAADLTYWTLKPQKCTAAPTLSLFDALETDTVLIDKYFLQHPSSLPNILYPLPLSSSSISDSFKLLWSFKFFFFLGLSVLMALVAWEGHQVAAVMTPSPRLQAAIFIFYNSLLHSNTLLQSSSHPHPLNQQIVRAVNQGHVLEEITHAMMS